MALHLDASMLKELKFDLMVKVLQRDDPLRQSYLQRRWHGHPTSVPLARGVGRYNEAPSIRHGNIRGTGYYH